MGVEEEEQEGHLITVPGDMAPRSGTRAPREYPAQVRSRAECIARKQMERNIGVRGGEDSQLLCLN